jgi:hypothetical protein
MNRALAVTALIGCALVAGAQAQPALTATSKNTMKQLLADGFELKSHQFYRCGNAPAQDTQESCISLMLQKGPRLASCLIDRAHFLVTSGPMRVDCVVFE